MKTLLAFVFAAWTGFALAQAPTAELPKPGTKDLCPVCGMLVSKYPNWVATIMYRDGHAHHFDGAKDFFKYLYDRARYEPGRKPADRCHQPTRKLMPDHPRVVEERVLAREDVVVGAADADMADADPHPAGLECRTGHIDQGELTWLRTQNGTHYLPPRR